MNCKLCYLSIKKRFPKFPFQNRKNTRLVHSTALLIYSEKLELYSIIFIKISIIRVDMIQDSKKGLKSCTFKIIYS